MLAIGGQGAFNYSSTMATRLTRQDASGIALQALSVVCSAGVKIALKTSEGLLDKADLMLARPAGLFQTTCLIPIRLSIRE